ncbi:hypothetical protein D3C78_951810 [compost metagenome]
MKSRPAAATGKPPRASCRTTRNKNPYEVHRPDDRPALPAARPGQRRAPRPPAASHARCRTDHCRDTALGLYLGRRGSAEELRPGREDHRRIRGRPRPRHRPRRRRQRHRPRPASLGLRPVGRLERLHHGPGGGRHRHHPDRHPAVRRKRQPQRRPPARRQLPRPARVLGRLRRPHRLPRRAPAPRPPAPARGKRPVAGHQHRSAELELRHHPAARSPRRRPALLRIPHRPRRPGAGRRGPHPPVRRHLHAVDAAPLGRPAPASRRRQRQPAGSGRSGRRTGQDLHRQAHLAGHRGQRRRLRIPLADAAELLGQRHLADRRPRPPDQRPGRRRTHRHRQAERRRQRLRCRPRPALEHRRAVEGRRRLCPWQRRRR